MNSRTFLIAAAAGLMAGAAWAQDAAQPQQSQAQQAQAQGGPWTDAPVLGGAAPSADCGGLHNLAGRAFCVTAPLGQMEVLSETYVSTLQDLGWLIAHGDDNRVVMIRRTGENQCDAIQMFAFYDTRKPAVPELPAYLGFATVPGNICAASAAAGTAPNP